MLRRSIFPLLELTSVNVTKAQACYLSVRKIDCLIRKPVWPIKFHVLHGISSWEFTVTLRMVFYPPSWVPKLPFGEYLWTPASKQGNAVNLRSDPPDSITISEFMTNPVHGRHPIEKSRNPFTCGLSGKTFTLAQFSSRYNFLACAIGTRLGWQVNEDTEWDKVACIFSFNTVCIAPGLIAVLLRCNALVIAGH